MRIIDKRGKEPQPEQQEKHEQAFSKKVKEPDETLIQVNPDYRMSSSLGIIKRDQSRWDNDGPSGRERFLEAVIKNRRTLEELEILDYDYGWAKKTAWRDKLICRVDQETLAALKTEARAAHLDLDAYMRALTYAYAKKLDEEKIRKDKEEEAQRSANTPTHFDIPLSKPLQAALLDKYPLTEQEEEHIKVDGVFKYYAMKKRVIEIIEEALRE